MCLYKCGYNFWKIEQFTKINYCFTFLTEAMHFHPTIFVLEHVIFYKYKSP